MARAVEASPTALAAPAARPIGVGGVAVARQRPNPDFGFEYDKETPHWAFTGTVPLEIGGKRLQAGLDYQLALAELERAIGTPLK